MTIHKLKQTALLSLFLLACMFMYIANKQTANVKLLIEKAQSYNMTNAGISYVDSVLFQQRAKYATVVDLPEELPMIGDSVCARISNDTIYIEYYNLNRYDGFEYQKDWFKFIYNQ